MYDDRYIFIKGDFNKEIVYGYITDETIDSMIFDFSTIKFCEWDNNFIRTNIIPKLRLDGTLYCDLNENMLQSIGDLYLSKSISLKDDLLLNLTNQTFEILCKTIQKTININKKSKLNCNKFYTKNNIKDIFFLNKIDDKLKAEFKSLIQKKNNDYKQSKERVTFFENQKNQKNSDPSSLIASIEKINEMLAYWKDELENCIKIEEHCNFSDQDMNEEFEIFDTELIDVIDVFKPNPEHCIKINLIENLLKVPVPTRVESDIAGKNFKYLTVTKVKQGECKKFTDEKGGIYL